MFDDGWIAPGNQTQLPERRAFSGSLIEIH